MTTNTLDVGRVVAAEIEAEIGGQADSIAKRAIRTQTILRQKMFNPDDPEVQALLKYIQCIVLYRTDNGKPVLTTRAMVKTQLGKTFRTDDGVDTGRPVFTSTRPAVPYRDGGALLCPLHPIGTDRTYYASFGLPKCSMAHLRSLKDLDLHMRHKHPTAFRIIEREREQKEKNEEREWRRTVMMQALGLKAAAPQRRQPSRRPKAAKPPSQPKEQQEG